MRFSRNTLCLGRRVPPAHCTFCRMDASWMLCRDKRAQRKKYGVKVTVPSRGGGMARGGDGKGGEGYPPGYQPCCGVLQPPPPPPPTDCNWQPLRHAADCWGLVANGGFAVARAEAS